MSLSKSDLQEMLKTTQEDIKEDIQSLRSDLSKGLADIRKDISELGARVGETESTVLDLATKQHQNDDRFQQMEGNFKTRWTMWKI